MKGPAGTASAGRRRGGGNGKSGSGVCRGGGVAGGRRGSVRGVEVRRTGGPERDRYPRGGGGARCLGRGGGEAGGEGVRVPEGTVVSPPRATPCHREACGGSECLPRPRRSRRQADGSGGPAGRPVGRASAPGVPWGPVPRLALRRGRGLGLWPAALLSWGGAGARGVVAGFGVCPRGTRGSRFPVAVRRVSGTGQRWELCWGCEIQGLVFQR